MFSIIVWGFLLAHATAIPPRGSSFNNHSPAIPFVEVAAYPGLPPLPGSELFRRQGCSSFSLPCPSGICCSYSPTVTTCCGKSCCAEGYYCTGGTPSNPCCVAANSRTNTCGNDNPCQTPGDLPCNGLDFCCPPNNICYVDSARRAMCRPATTTTSRKYSTTTSGRYSTTTTSSSRGYWTTTTTTTYSWSYRPTSYSAYSTSSTTSARKTAPTPIRDDAGMPLTVYTYPPSQSDFLPWTWFIKSSNSGAVCPSAAKTLVTFASVNIIVAVISMILCHRKVVQIWSLGICGSADSKMWMWSWIIPLGLQLGANAIIATIYKDTPGYEEGFSVADLFLFWTTRPRLSWLLLAAFIGVGVDVSEGNNGYWTSAAKSAMIAEIILLLVSTYYMGWTANFGRVNGFYSLHSTAIANAKLMYAGALMSLIFIFGTLIYTSVIVLKHHDIDSTGIVLGFLVGIATTTWLASWLFWVGFLYTAGDLYCPPNLAATGSIWAIFSIVGNMLGGGGM